MDLDDLDDLDGDLDLDADGDTFAGQLGGDPRVASVAPAQPNYPTVENWPSWTELVAAKGGKKAAAGVTSITDLDWTRKQLVAYANAVVTKDDKIKAKDLKEAAAKLDKARLPVMDRKYAFQESLHADADRLDRNDRNTPWGRANAEVEKKEGCCETQWFSTSWEYKANTSSWTLFDQAEVTTWQRANRNAKRNANAAHQPGTNPVANKLAYEHDHLWFWQWRILKFQGKLLYRIIAAVLAGLELLVFVCLIELMRSYFYDSMKKMPVTCFTEPVYFDQTAGMDSKDFVTAKTEGLEDEAEGDAAMMMTSAIAHCKDLIPAFATACNVTYQERICSFWEGQASDNNIKLGPTGTAHYALYYDWGLARATQVFFVIAMALFYARFFMLALDIAANGRRHVSNWHRGCKGDPG